MCNTIYHVKDIRVLYKPQVICCSISAKTLKSKTQKVSKNKKLIVCFNYMIVLSNGCQHFVNVSSSNPILCANFKTFKYIHI